MEKNLQFQFNSKVENIYPVERSILERAKELNFNEDVCFSLRLAMDEAFINAIIHGNNNLEDKSIHVIANFYSDSIEVTVRDEGDGFDLSQLYDPRDEPHLYDTHGRGVFLIRQFTNEVRFNDKGNEITFVVHRTQPSPVMQSCK